MDTQIIALRGRNKLIDEILSAGLEVALPERDRGIDLIAYLDKGRKFIARPIQVKAASNSSFSIHKKYKRFPHLILAYVWNLSDPQKAATYALTYRESVEVAKKIGWTKSPSWQDKNSYSNSHPGKKIQQLLEPFKMTPERWKKIMEKSSD